MEVTNSKPKLKIGFVLCAFPGPFDLDMIEALAPEYEPVLIAPESLTRGISRLKTTHNRVLRSLQEGEESQTYMHCLESALEDCGVVFINDRSGFNGYLLLKLKRKLKFQLIVNVTNLSPTGNSEDDHFRVVRKELLNSADQVWVQTTAAANLLKVSENIQNKIVTIKPYVKDLSLRSKSENLSAKKSLGLHENDFVVSFLGFVEWESNLTDLIYASMILKSELPEIRRIKILIYGFGDYSSKLKQHLIRDGLEEAVHLLKPWEHSPEAILQASNALYFAPIISREYRDGSPLSILAAMKMGIPIISHRNPVIEELIGKHRLDFCQGSPSSLAAAIKKAMLKQRLVNDICQKNQVHAEKMFAQSLATQSIHKALADCLQREPLTFNEPVSHLLLEAESLVSTGFYLSSVDLLEKIFKNPDLNSNQKSQAYQLMGDAFAKMGDLTGSVEAYQMALGHNPRAAKVFLGLGTVNLIRKDYNQAIALFQQVLDIEQQNSMAALGIGLCYQEMSEFEHALSWVTKSLDWNPTNTPALYTLVKLAKETMNYIVAEKYLQNYLQRKPSDQNMRIAWAAVLSQIGNHKAVRDSMEKIILDDPLNQKANHLFHHSDLILKNLTHNQQ